MQAAGRTQRSKARNDTMTSRSGLGEAGYSWDMRTLLSSMSTPMMIVPIMTALVTIGCAEAELDDYPEKRQPIPEDERPGLGDDGGGDDGGGDDGGGDGGDGGDGGGDDGDTEPQVEQAEACHDALLDWPGGWTDKEEDIVDLINEARAAGANCGSYGNYSPTGPVEMDPDLQCAARYHSLWMAEENAFDHDSPGGDLGDDPWERIDSTDFNGSAVGENIAAGYASAKDAVDGWIDSDGHCANLMNPQATLTGVGYYSGGSWGHYWTQNFGR